MKSFSSIFLCVLRPSWNAKKAATIMAKATPAASPPIQACEGDDGSDELAATPRVPTPVVVELTDDEDEVRVGADVMEKPVLVTLLVLRALLDDSVPVMLHDTALLVSLRTVVGDVQVVVTLGVHVGVQFSGIVR